MTICSSSCLLHLIQSLKNGIENLVGQAVLELLIKTLFSMKDEGETQVKAWGIYFMKYGSSISDFILTYPNG